MEVNFTNVDRIFIDLALKITSRTRVIVSALIHATLARSFLSLVKSPSLLFAVGILKNETLGVFLLLLQP